MSKQVIMPALGMAQETGVLLEWLKAPGEAVAKGEPLMLVETDKASVQVEATESGILSNVTAQAGDRIPVGQVIATILSPNDLTQEIAASSAAKPAASLKTTKVRASPVAARMAAEHGIDLLEIQPRGAMIQKDDVLAYLATQTKTIVPELAPANGSSIVAASPKARRLAAERGVELGAIPGSGPGGAVLAADVLAAPIVKPAAAAAPEALVPAPALSRLKRWRLAESGR